MKFAAIFHVLCASSIYAVEESTTRRLQTATYAPGDFSEGLTVDAGNGRTLYLSNGLKANIIGSENETVTAADGTEFAMYHKGADGGDTIPAEGGGYYYVSNSEMGEQYPVDFDLASDRSLLAANLTGGVYAWEFNADHEVVGYQQLLNLTTGNCAGGATPWNTWISCEERRMWGQCWQVDPAGVIESRPTSVMGPLGVQDYGAWEAFAWDADKRVGYTTNDDFPAPDLPDSRGTIVRYTPDDTALACLDATTDADKWCALESGALDFLKLNPNAMTFEWVSDLAEANPDTYPGSEGVHYEDGVVTFVTVVDKMITRLNVDDGTYTSSPVPFPQEPDNIRIFGDVLYICTDGDLEPDDGIWGVDTTGAFRVIKEVGHNYPAGIAFSPDGMMMYLSMWGEATYQISRTDGMAFDAETAGITYEETGAPAPAPTAGGEEGSSDPSPTVSGSAGGNDWSMTMMMVACVVAVAVPAFVLR